MLTALLWSAFVLVGQAMDCPTSDIYAVGLDAYTLEVQGERVSFVLREEVDPHVVSFWTELLFQCGAVETGVTFAKWSGHWVDLLDLGGEFHDLKVWQWKQRYILRRKIRDMENTIALEYVEFLRGLQLETGIKVCWKKGSHPLIKGMISTGGGSELVADYVESTWVKNGQKKSYY